MSQLSSILKGDLKRQSLIRHSSFYTEISPFCSLANEGGTSRWDPWEGLWRGERIGIQVKWWKREKVRMGGHGSRNEFPAMSFLWALILVSLLDVPRRLQHNNSLYFLLPLLSLESYPQLNHPIKSLKLDLYWRSFCKFLEVKNARAGKMLQIPRSSISC